jgi:hypothetical protein
MNSVKDKEGGIKHLSSQILQITIKRSDFNMNLDSFKSLENELTKNIPPFYQELLKTWINL